MIYSPLSKSSIPLLRAGFDFSLANLMFEIEELRELISIEEESPVCTDKTKLIEAMTSENISLMYINSARELL